MCLSGSYVPTHLHLMVFELVKNSLRAVQERFMDSDKVAPPVRIIVADGLEDVTIKAGAHHSRFLVPVPYSVCFYCVCLIILCACT